jgi:hypothetical protein
MVSCVAAYVAPKFARESPCNAMDALLSTVVIQYPCCKAKTAVWLTSAIASAQYSLKELIVSMIGGTAFLQHSTLLDDTQANVNGIAVVHWVGRSTCVGSANT